MLPLLNLHGIIILQRSRSMLDLWANDENGEKIFSKHHYEKRGWLPAGTVEISYGWGWSVDSQFRDVEQTRAEMNIVAIMEDEPAIPNREDAVNWWLYENCKGRWDKILKTKIEFELAADAVFFKMIWT